MSEYATITCKPIHETENAILIDQKGNQCWIGKSQIKRKLTFGNPIDNNIEIDIPEWLAEANELDY